MTDKVINFSSGGGCFQFYLISSYSYSAHIVWPDCKSRKVKHIQAHQNQPGPVQPRKGWCTGFILSKSTF